jgi:ectoine hydroxylase
MVEKYGEPVAITGKPGSVVLFHPHLVHGSGHNMSIHSRWHVYVVYNRSSHPPAAVENPRPEWVVSRDYTPLAVGSDDAIVASQHHAPIL